MYLLFPLLKKSKYYKIKYKNGGIDLQYVSYILVLL
jgi:hypothetical protein